MSKTLCRQCGHRRHEGRCPLCRCETGDLELAREAVVQARRDEMYRPPAHVTLER